VAALEIHADVVDASDVWDRLREPGSDDGGEPSTGLTVDGLRADETHHESDSDTSASARQVGTPFIIGGRCLVDRHGNTSATASVADHAWTLEEIARLLDP